MWAWPIRYENTSQWIIVNEPVLFLFRKAQVEWNERSYFFFCFVSLPHPVSNLWFDNDDDDKSRAPSKSFVASAAKLIIDTEQGTIYRILYRYILKRSMNLQSLITRSISIASVATLRRIRWQRIEYFRLAITLLIFCECIETDSLLKPYPITSCPHRPRQ